jgi:hypothetical protein
MKCPKCGGEQYCPCYWCKLGHKQKVVWKWVSPNGPIACGHCGHTMKEDEWERESIKQYEKISSLPDL